MNQRIGFIERIRKDLHKKVDVIIDSIYGPCFKNSKNLIIGTKVDLDRLQNQIKKDE